MGILLTIIIPTYNLNDYADRILNLLDKQINNKIEVIVIDDGSEMPYSSNYKWVKIIRLEKNSGTASKPRNVGLDVAKGKYIAFIDVDDLVTENYINKIMSKIRKQPDIIYLSWKSKVHDIKIITRPPKWNCAVWCRVYKRELIGETRFDEKLRKAEDWVFNQQVKPKTSLVIKEQIYIYNNGRKGSICNE